MSSLLTWDAEVPQLRRPILVIALEGFVDAGDAASTAALFLRHRWRSEVVATFDRDLLIDYRARRPSGIVDSGTVRRIEWPQIELLAATVDGPHDALLLLGPEPDMRWSAFCDAIAALCREVGVEHAIGLGAYPAPVPHTRPIRILHASNSAAEPSQFPFIAIPRYTGPVGVATVLHDLLAATGIPGVGLWAEIPHYIAASPNPAAAMALTRAVADLFGTAVDTSELEAAAKLHHEQVDEAVAEHEEAAEMIRALEEHIDLGGTDQLPSGDDLAAEIERFLRAQSD